MHEDDWVLARANGAGIWKFYRTREEAAAAMAAVNAERAQNDAADPGYEPMSCAEYKARERALWLDHGPVAITEETYVRMLEILPPMAWRRRDGVESFLMSEFMTASYTHQYASVDTPKGLRYFTRMVDVCDESTWMTYAGLEDAGLIPKQ